MIPREDIPRPQSSNEYSHYSNEDYEYHNYDLPLERINSAMNSSQPSNLVISNIEELKKKIISTDELIQNIKQYETKSESIANENLRYKAENQELRDKLNKEQSLSSSRYLEIIDCYQRMNEQLHQRINALEKDLKGKDKPILNDKKQSIRSLKRLLHDKENEIKAQKKLIDDLYQIVQNLKAKLKLIHKSMSSISNIHEDQFDTVTINHVQIQHNLIIANHLEKLTKIPMIASKGVSISHQINKNNEDKQGKPKRSKANKLESLHVSHKKIINKVNEMMNELLENEQLKNSEKMILSQVLKDRESNDGSIDAKKKKLNKKKERIWDDNEISENNSEGNEVLIQGKGLKRDGEGKKRDSERDKKRDNDFSDDCAYNEAVVVEKKRKIDEKSEHDDIFELLLE